MAGIWLSRLDSNGQLGEANSQELRIARSEAQSQQRTLEELTHQIGRLSLMNQALWEILRERLKLTDADLEQRVKDIDLRDGVEDGEVTNVPLQCPTCGRISNSKHWKCLYCGQVFERPATA